MVTVAKQQEGTSQSSSILASLVQSYDSQHIHPTVKPVVTIPKAKYGGRYTVTMLPGGGIGPELMEYVKEVFQFAGVPVDFETISIDPLREGNEEFEYAMTSIKRNGVCLKGNIETKSFIAGVPSRNVAIRSELDLFVSLLHCKSYPGIKCRHKGIDVVVVRQNTEGEYSMLEHESVHGVVESMKVVTTKNAERVARYGFEYAQKNGRKKVTTVHKANIMKLSDGLFLETSRRVAKDYPDIKHNDMIIDNCCMQLVSNPHQFDVMIMTNLYGAIVSNVVCGLVGGAGLISGRNYGDHYAVFEPGTRNTGTSIAGKNIANPTAMLNASADMLEHLEFNYHASNIKKAIEFTINEDHLHTPDLGGTSSSTDVIHNILKRIGKLSRNHNWYENESIFFGILCLLRIDCLNSISQLHEHIGVILRGSGTRKPVTE
ncbi:isocitrate dehydrogenase [NAD] subunit gamma, mitochondrial-like [Hetaerina americana]|uniref:isocitrate dehydrogenase [NAD] subunit gamma, mitochondrial-like n=1 Tax=Hetaerina americana TaxID=62018 RepID=UPI003A7F232D